MKQCAFTIVAKNYIGLGQILGKSLQKHNPEIDFHIFVSDEFESIPPSLPKEAIMAKNVLSTSLSEEQWTDMAFKYDLTEFCTAIKPFCFEYIFSQGYEKGYYFDPDIYIFSSIHSISEALDNHSMALTPQVVGIHPFYTGEHPEWAMNVNGIFNLGFCAIRHDEWGMRVVEWWKERLRDQAFADRSVGQFTDQKWMDWIPAFLGNRLCVLQSMGMNLAPWNFFEREVYQTPEGVYKVKNRTADKPSHDDLLVFVHFAGYDYNQLKQGVVSRKRIEDLKEYDDINIIGSHYRDAIVDNADLFDSFIAQPYSYATYSNGEPIAGFHRRLYHGLEQKPSNPFSTHDDSFYAAIKKKGMLIHESIDGLSRKNMGNMNETKKKLSFFYRMLFRLLGYKKYVMFLKSLYFYCRPEEHTFLINYSPKGKK